MGLVVATAVVVYPVLPWVVLALWTATMVRPVHEALNHAFGARPRLAALVAVALLTLLVVPAAVVIALLAGDAIDLVERLLASDRARDMLSSLVADGSREAPRDLVGAAMSIADRAWNLAHEIAGTAATIVIGLLILVTGTYAFLVDGARWYRWVEDHVPVSAVTLRRFAAAFSETGHGLLIGIVGAGLAQSIIATCLYLVLDVPEPLVLGLLTLAVSVVPAVGTAIVWVPLSVGLAATGRPGAAAILAITGVTVIGTIDNLIRPYLARRGHLQLPTFVVLIAMFGGIHVLGGWGLVIGPLVVRLAKEAVAIWAEDRR